MPDDIKRKVLDRAKSLPPKPTDFKLPDNDKLKLAILQARMSAVLPLIFLMSALAVLALSFVYPDRAQKLNVGGITTGLITTAGALTKPNG